MPSFYGPDEMLRAMGSLDSGFGSLMWAPNHDQPYIWLDGEPRPDVEGPLYEIIPDKGDIDWDPPQWADGRVSEGYVMDQNQRAQKPTEYATAEEADKSWAEWEQETGGKRPDGWERCHALPSAEEIATKTTVSVEVIHAS